MRFNQSPNGQRDLYGTSVQHTEIDDLRSTGGHDRFRTYRLRSEAQQFRGDVQIARATDGCL